MFAALAARCPRALCGTLRAFSTDTVALSGLAFYARHGVLDAERTLGQKFVVDLHMHVPTPICKAYKYVHLLPCLLKHVPFPR